MGRGGGGGGWEDVVSKTTQAWMDNTFDGLWLSVSLAYGYCESKGDVVLLYLSANYA